jgi:hypothetical protein
VNLEALAVLDLLTGDTCNQRRMGLMELKKHGRSQEARDAFQKAYALREKDNACMRADLEELAPR